MSRRCLRRGSAESEIFNRRLRSFLGLLLGWRPQRRTPYNCWIGNAGFGNRVARPVFLYRCYRCVVTFILAQGSRLLFLAEFLESGIGAQRVPDRIEPKKGRRNGR